MGHQAGREHRLSKDRVYPSVGDWDAPKTQKALPEDDKAEAASALITVNERRLDTTPVAPVALRTFVKPMGLDEINAAIDTRHDMSPEELTSLIQLNFSGSLLSLRQLRPFIEEIKRRFKHLPRKVGVDGQYKTISGHRNFKSWCGSGGKNPKGILRRTDRAVRYMLAKAGDETKEKESRTEEVSAVSCRVQKYLTDRADKFQESERRQFLESVGKILENLSASTKAMG